MNLKVVLFQLIAPFIAMLLVACVTINIYFPAEKVETVAEDIVEDIRGNENTPSPDSSKNKKEPLSYLHSLLNLFSPKAAFAQEITEVSNAAIRSLKENMRLRYSKMKSFYIQKVFAESDSGYVVEGDMNKLDLKTRRLAKKLMEAENADRKALYKEVATALKIDPGQLNQVEEIFAKQWQKSAPK